MNLYEFVDEWLYSKQFPGNSGRKFSKKEMFNSLSDFLVHGIKNETSAVNIDHTVNLAYQTCVHFLDANASGESFSWENFPEAQKLKEVELGDAVWQGYSVSSSDESVLKEMFLDGIHIISDKEASAIFNSVDAKGHYQSSSPKLLHVDEKDGEPIVFVAIDNQSGDAWTEDFKTLDGAAAWLDGASLEEIQEDYPEERPDKSLQDLCNEPIVGDVMIAGVHIIIDPKLTDVTYNEAVNYIELCEKQKGNKSDKITEIVLKPEPDDNISIDWTVKPLPFDRIRRITGYLVGDLNRWNNAKRQEEHDRVKHGIRNMGGLVLTVFAALFLQFLKDFFTIFDR